MRRFVWRLQRVLDIKAKQELIKTQELFALTEKIAQTRGELLAEQRTLIDIFESIANENPKDRLGKQEFFLRYSAATDERIRQLKTCIAELEARQKEKVAEVLKIRRFKEGLERLREQAKMKFIEEQEKLEQKELDETATLGFTRESRDANKDDWSDEVKEMELSVGLKENAR